MPGWCLFWRSLNARTIRSPAIPRQFQARRLMVPPIIPEKKNKEEEEEEGQSPNPPFNLQEIESNPMKSIHRVL
ncbi:hypothetical protein CRG98_042133 [Punica granatum]|uniref:Uncharacterized protein n=1 Tax=Punica granatum TaxID=22663 RepID=A0A2I0I0I2_PUNGR|nr:hypothetical protein CRG98_042133 [Punica granatum]